MKRGFLALLLLSRLAGADPVVHLTAAERDRLELYRFRRGQGAFASQVVLRPDNARLFLALVEETKDAKERAAAIQAVDTIYSPNPKPGLVFEGKRYDLVELTPEYREVTRNLLGNRALRAEGLEMAGNCVWGTQPDGAILPILKAWYLEEFSPEVKDRLLKTAIRCQAPDPNVTTMLVWGLREAQPLGALACLTNAYQAGTDYGPEFRTQVTPLLEGLLKSPQAELRAAALGATVAMTPKSQRRNGLLPLFRGFLRDPAGAVVRATLVAIADCHAYSLLPEVCTLLDDTRPTTNKTPVQHFALRALAILSEDAAGPGNGFQYPYVDRLEGIEDKPFDTEAVRAKLWLRSHRQFAH